MDTDALIEQLRARHATGNTYLYGSQGTLINPDGPEAATRIESLEARIEAAEKVISETRRLIVGCCDSGFTDEDAVMALYRNNGALTNWLRAAAQWQAGQEGEG